MQDKYLNFAVAERKAKGMSIEALEYTINDARAARDAQPDGKNAGYYADEVIVYSKELESRLKKPVTINKEKLVEIARVQMELIKMNVGVGTNMFRNACEMYELVQKL